MSSREQYDAAQENWEGRAAGGEVTEDEKTRAAKVFAAVMHETMAKLEKAEARVKRLENDSDLNTGAFNDLCHEFNDAQDELIILRAIVAELRPSDEIEAKPEVRPLPCIVCGTQPEPVSDKRGGTRQPYAATMFNAGSGHYGSTVWDDMTGGRTLEINVCDACLIARKERVAMVVETVEREYEYLPWRVDDEESPDA